MQWRLIVLPIPQSVDKCGRKCITRTSGIHSINLYRTLEHEQFSTPESHGSAGSSCDNNTRTGTGGVKEGCPLLDGFLATPPWYTIRLNFIQDEEIDYGK
jgi:hypothetical protein